MDKLKQIFEVIKGKGGIAVAVIIIAAAIYYFYPEAAADVDAVQEIITEQDSMRVDTIQLMQDTTIIDTTYLDSVN